MTSAFLRLRQRGRHLPRVLGQLARYGIPRRSLLFGPKSLGDDLLCTAVLREARLRGKPLTLFSRRPELFAHNPDPLRVLPIDDYFIATLRKLGAEVIQPYYVSADLDKPDRDILPPRHVIAEMCRLVGLSGAIRLRPYLNLTPEECSFGGFFSRQITVQSSGLSAAIPYRNKEWGPDRFAAVARLLSPEFKLVQIGSAADPALPVDLDLRGKTSLREAAAVLANSAVFLGLEGFLVHLARAVECPSVVVFGGRARPEVFGYSANHNLFTSPPCSPCGLRNTCAFEMACMTSISPEAVRAAVVEVTRRERSELPVDVVELP